MANEILYSGLGDLRTTEVLAAEIDLLLADRHWLWGHPALVYRGDVGGRGSDTVKFGQAGLGGYDEMAAVAENASVTSTALTDASVTLAIARQSLQRTVSDLARITDPAGGLININALAADMVASAMARFTTMLAALGTGFSSSVGTTTADLTVANWFSAVSTLELANVDGPYISVLHSQQVADLRTALRSETGPMEHMGPTQDTIAAVGQASAGRLLGVDILRVNRIPTANAGADRAGFMFARGAIHWADAAVPGIPGVPSALKSGGRISVSIDLDGGAGNAKVTGDYYCAVGENQDGMGVGIVTDA